MASTVISSFQQFSKNLEITDLQRATVATRQQMIREAMENGMEVLDSFLTGSYCRHTMIAPLSKADIDIFVVLSPSHHSPNGQKSLLDEVKRVLKKRYTQTPEISRNGQAATITFTDFLVDVVPGFNRRGGGFLIPDSKNGVWISTNPKYHIEYKSGQNDVHNGNLVPIIKMIKCWNRYNNSAFISFYLELLAIKIFNNVTIPDYPSGIRFFLDKGREAIKYKIQDPVHYGGNINGLQNAKTVSDATQLFETGYNITLKAESFNQNGDNEKAINEWRKIFGDYFPAYTR